MQAGLADSITRLLPESDSGYERIIVQRQARFLDSRGHQPVDRTQPGRIHPEELGRGKGHYIERILVGGHHDRRRIAIIDFFPHNPLLC